MPLLKSKSQEAFKSNLKQELKAGNPMKQSLAIAYSMKKRKKMADGGPASGPTVGSIIGYPGANQTAPMTSPSPKPTPKGYARGALITDNYQPSYIFKEFPDLNDYDEDSGFLPYPPYDHEANQSAVAESDKDLNQHGQEDEGPEGAYAQGDIVSHIMRKRMSEGGKVANDTPIEAGFKENDFDDLALRDDLKSSYGEGNNSGDESGNAQEDADRHDIIARIMKSRAKKDRMPRPA